MRLTPLHRAAQKGDLSEVTALLERVRDNNVSDTSPPLHARFAHEEASNSWGEP
jgi:hypothetical protein